MDKETLNRWPSTQHGLGLYAVTVEDDMEAVTIKLMYQIEQLRCMIQSLNDRWRERGARGNS